MFTNGGVTGLYTSATQELNEGGWNLLNYIGFISILVGSANLMPITPFDGGHVLRLLLQKYVQPKKLEQFFGIYTIIGVALALFLSIVPLLGDVWLLLKSLFA